MSRKSKKELLNIAAESEGHGKNIEALLQAAAFDMCPGVCRECGAVVIEVEPDAEGYSCEECGNEHSVDSVLVIAEVI